MFPIRDENPTHSTAYVTIGLIVVNCLIFLTEVWGPVDESEFTWKYGFVPAELVQSSDDFAEGLRQNPPKKLLTDEQGRPLVDLFGRGRIINDEAAYRAATSLPAWFNIFTCMFLHGGWMHLLGNMLFLWIFGNNIEDKLGPWLFIIFYLGTGICGNLAHTFFDAGYVPLVGASGAISGVMGAYVLLFPKTRILAIVPIGWYPATFSLPAWVYLGFYILLQNLWPAFRGGEGNVAYWAHIGGFAAGMAMIYVFPHRKYATRAAPTYDPDQDDADFVL
ncbi:MAG: rhomboid family intramembrane serine protease [Phycisphaerales bacterium]|nr:rhomboid family intramembrane serine protease [Phycisphaerales bacterium]